MTHTDCTAKAALQFPLKPARSHVRIGGAKLADPGLHWLGHLVRMTMTIIQKSHLRFLLVASQLSEAVSSGTRHVQMALGHNFLPHVTRAQRLNTLQHPP